MSDKNKHKELETLGEFGLIRLLTRDIKLQNPSSVVGVGDDAAVLNMGDLQTVVTTDLLTEGIHFDLMYTPLKHLGYKAVIVNLSDVYAMNAIPQQVVVSIALSAKYFASNSLISKSCSSSSSYLNICKISICKFVKAPVCSTISLIFFKITNL